jgi:PAS domain S-box-containing protein
VASGRHRAALFLIALTHRAIIHFLLSAMQLRSFRPRLSVRGYFLALLASILVPAMALAWWLAELSVSDLRRGIEREIQKEAEKVSIFVDREVIGIQNMLMALATSPSLQNRDFQGFYLQAAEMAKRLNTQIVLRDLDRDEQVVNTALPWGEPLLHGNPVQRSKAQEAALRSGSPIVSGVFWAPIVRRYLIAVQVPLAIQGAPYLLTVGIRTERFVEIIANTQPGRDHIVTISDGARTVVARSDRHDKFVGKRLPVSDEARFAPEQGILHGRNMEGVPFHWGYVRSPVTGWNIGAGVPERILDAAANRALARFSAAGAGIFVVALIAVYGVGGRFARSFGALGIDRSPTREEFQVLFESAPNGVVVVDGSGQVALLNAQMENMFGYSREELIGKPVEMLIPEHFRNMHAKVRAEFGKLPEARAMGAGRDLFGLRKDGSEFPIEIGLNPISTSAGTLVMATVVDITRRRRAAEQLSLALSERDQARQRFLQAQEDERLRLAQELHDQTGQSLTAVMLELKAIENQVDERGRDRLRLLRRQLEQMGKTLHQVAWELRPTAMDEVGLAVALAERLAEWSAQTGIETDFHCADHALDDLTSTARTTIYRVVQEALTNAAKHAGARAVSLVIDEVEGMLRIIIEDDGCGFDPACLQRPTKQGGLGIVGMRERLSVVGGRLEVESSAGRGTSIFATIPLERSRIAA